MSPTEHTYNPVTPEVVEALVASVGGDKDRVKYCGAEADAAEIKRHSLDHSYHMGHEPEAVVFPLDTDEVKAIMKVAAANGIPVTTASARTGLEGGAIPMEGGIVCDMLRMNKVLEVHRADMQVTLQAGVMKKDMIKFAEENGYFFAVDPGSEASLGGYASTGASGTLSVKYGTMRDNVVRLHVVLSDGRDMWTRARSVKSSMGYDLNRLFLGAEGTLGIVTELTLKIYPAPTGIVAAMASFKSLHDTADAVIAISTRMPTTLARCELLNVKAIECVNSLFNRTHPVHPTLFLEFHGVHDHAAAEADANRLEAVCREHGATLYTKTADPEEREALWQARKGAYFASYKARTGPNIKLCVTDVCVPISKFADMVSETEEDFAKNSDTNLPCPIVGHACDGNFHVMCAFDSKNEAEVEDLKALEHRMVLRAIRAGGTASGEHGVGLGKRKFMEVEHGSAFVDVMRKVKDALDPHHLMNPTKILLPPSQINGAVHDGLVSSVFENDQGGCGSCT